MKRNIARINTILHERPGRAGRRLQGAPEASQTDTYFASPNQSL